MKKNRIKSLDNKLLIGRSEWCQLPELKIPEIKAKIDTGAKTSAIHAFNINVKTKNKQLYAYFDIHPLQANSTFSISCRAPIIDQREIMSSNGHKESRYIIVTKIAIGSQYWDIELSLSNRDPLRYRLLLGREALNRRVVIDPSICCNQGKLVYKKNINK